MAEKIDGLYLSLGLDSTQLDADFAATDKEVRAKLAELSRQTKATKLETQIKINGLEGTENAARRLTTTQQGLNSQLNIQQQRVNLLANAYQQTVKRTGEASAASQNMYNRLLQESKAYSDLQAQIRRTREEQTGGPATGGSSGAIASLTDKMAKLQSQMVALSAVTATGMGFYKIIKDAAQAGENAYQLSHRLGVTTKEAGELGRVLKLGGVDVQTFGGVMTRLDKQLLTAGANGNELTKAMSSFGFSLTDSSGRLMPMTAQLEQLAQGYKNAAAQGRESEYAATVLGARGQELLPIIRQLTELKDEASKIQPTKFLDPEAAHQFIQDSKVLDTQFKQLATTAGAALMPALKGIMDELIPMAQSLQGVANASPVATTAFVQLATDAGLALGALKALKLAFPDVMATLATKYGSLGLGGPGGVAVAATMAVKDLQDSYYSDRTKELTGHSPDQNNANVRLNDEGKWEKEIVDQSYGIKTWVEVSEEERKELDKKHDAVKRGTTDTEEAAKAEKEAATQAAANAAAKAEADKKAEEQKKKMAEADKAYRETEIETFKLERTGIANSLMDLEIKAQALKAKGVAEEAITRYTEASKAKIMQDFQRSTTDKMNEIYETALQKRLNDIEREKEAFRQKGASEVETAKWAEEQKLNAARDAAAEAVRTNHDMLNKVRNILAEGAGGQTITGKDINGNPFSYTTPKQDVTARLEELSQQEARKARAKNGISESETFSPELMQAYQALTKNINRETYKGLEGSSTLQDYLTGGQASKVINNNPTINVSIGSPLVENEEMLSKLGDVVADRLRPAITEALGGANNGY